MVEPKRRKRDIREGKQIHIRIPTEIHRKLKIRVAEEDTNMQDWVSNLIENKLNRKKK